MVKTIIIDDETHIREGLRELIDSHFYKDIVIVAEANSVSDGVVAVEKYEPDLLLLDINLKDGNGFELISKSKYKDFEVIFITGYDNHAIKAIRVGALDYILKPVDEDEFREAVIKAIEVSKKGDQLGKLIEVSNEYFKGTEEKRVILKTSDTIYAVYESDIIYCQSDGNYTTFFTSQKQQIIVSKSIKKIEEILTEDLFIRCHQSFMVNRKYVVKYNKQGVLVLHSGQIIPVSSRRKEHTFKMIFE